MLNKNLVIISILSLSILACESKPKIIVAEETPASGAALAETQPSGVSPGMGSNAPAADVHQVVANEILQTIPYFDDVKNKINVIQPAGLLTNLDLKWTENKKTEISLKAQFDKLSLKSFEDVPGFENLSGTIRLSNKDGSLKLKSADVSLSYNKLFREQLKFSDLHGDLKWTESYLMFKNISFNNPFINGSINGSIKYDAQKVTYLDIQASIPYIDFKQAKTYYPRTISAEGLHWLDTSLLEGNLENTLVAIKGSTADFPFVDANNRPDPSKGKFIVTTTGKNTLIEYGVGWPVVEKFDFNA
jgi:uncharacterized protein YhdP